MKSRREFLQLAALTAALIGSRSFNSVAAKQSLTQDSLLEFNSNHTGAKYKLKVIIELKGQEKPAYVAETLSMFIT